VVAAAPAADADARRLLHELQVHEAELEQQNEELREARNELSAGLRRYFDLYETAPAGLVTVDRAGIVLEINRRGREMLAGTDLDLIGLSMLDCVAESSRDSLWLAIAGPHPPPGRRGVDIGVLRRDGSTRTLRAELQDRPSGNDSLLLALTDITARQQAEAELAHTREILELSNRIARIGYWELELPGRRMRWSAVACEIHGEPPDSGPDLETALGHYAAGDSRERLRRAMEEAIAGGTPFDLELQIHRGPGQERWVRKIGVPEMAGGRCRRLYGTFQDVDARVQAEGARLAQVRAEAANRSKSAFLSRMSHELRTPLNAVLGFAQLLQFNDAVRASATASLQVRHIHGAGEQLLALVNDVLDLARLEAGSARLASDAVAVGPLAAECVALTAALAAHHGVSLRIAGHEDGLRALGDRKRLSQVLVNLLTNAVKYNRRGGQVDVRIGADAGGVSIAVRDTGSGLRPDQIAELFQPFNRLGAERGGVEGTGLGLVIARDLVQAMEGTLQVHSAPGLGSEFTVRLRPVAAAPVASEPLAAAGAAPGPAPARPTLVLYVEDNPVNAELMRAIVAQREGFRLEIATDGEAGLQAVRHLRPDLVLLDMNLPLLDGAQVLQHMRADPALASIPCVAVSANAMATDIQRALDAGFADYITKPFPMGRVLALLDQLRQPAAADPA
jgi:hypothetical protein